MFLNIWNLTLTETWEEQPFSKTNTDKISQSS